MSTLSAILLVGAIQGLIVSVSLLCSKNNLTSNRFLAGLILLVSLKLTPYILGFSGYFQKFPWLTFAPFELESGFGPLLFLSVSSLTLAKAPKNWRLHLIPLAIEFFYYFIVFIQPLEFKNTWHSNVQVYVNYLDTYGSLISMSVYLGLSWQRVKSYQTWTDHHQTQGDPAAIRFLKVMLAAMAVLLALDSAFSLFQDLNPQAGYLSSYPFYLWITIFTYILGTGALKHSERIPPEVYPAAEPPAPEAAQTTASEGSWAAEAKEVRRKFESKKMWEDPLLSLESLAESLSVSPSHLSKVINRGEGESFSVFVNRYRVQEMVERLKDPAESRDILELAFECGFNSKASFNRAFRQFTGETPRDFRQRHRSS